MATAKPTIKLGSKGPAVSQWQIFLASKASTLGDAFRLVADGDFGLLTDAATRGYQASVGLKPDGIVGPLTWSKALGTEVTTSAPRAGGTSDAAAYEAVKKALPAGQYTEAERQYLLAVARGESFYGRGWKDPGKGSHNWGAVQGTGDAGSFAYGDSHADGSKYVGKFKRYSSDKAGIQDMARILFKPNLRKALNEGRSLRDAVFTQHANRYFELHPEKYLSAVKRNYQALTDALGWQPMLSESGGTPSSGGAGAILGVFGLLAAMGGLLYYVSKR